MKTSKKVSGKMSKEMRGALKTKRKIANFIEKAERLQLSEDANSSVEEEGIMEVTLVSDDSDVEIERTKMFRGPSKQVEVEDFDDNDGDADTAASQPHLRRFSNAVHYRKVDCNSILLAIEPPEKLYFAGKAIIRVLKGVVDVFGFRFGADGKKYTVFSAKGHSSLLCISAITGNGDRRSGESDEDVEPHPNVSNEELASIGGAVIIMEGFENDWCDGLRHIYPDVTNFIGPSITGIGPGKTPPLKSFMDKLGFQLVNSRSEKLRLMEFPKYWDDIFGDLTKKFDCSTGKICPFGGKGVGKSSFVRWLTNRFLSSGKTDRVLFIDLDPGQTEFTPPGMISVQMCTEPILGPNFTHLKEPVRSIFLGGVNVADYPVSYIKGVAELMEFCIAQEEFQSMPWMVNTMGFSQGLGVHLACEIVKIIRPNCVIQLNINNERRSFPFLLNKENVSNHQTFLSGHLSQKYRAPLRDYVFLSVKSACDRGATSNTSAWGTTPKIARELVLVSYFAEKIGCAEGFTLRSVVPLCVPLDSVAVGTLNSNLSYDEIIDTINGNLVALCEIADSTLQTKDASSKFITKAGNYTNNCLGYGIVRATDKQSRMLFIVSPVQETEILLKVNVIIGAGGIGLPIHLYIQSTADKFSNDAPYIMNRNEGTSTLHTAAKKFFVPKRVTHSVLKNCLL